MSGENKEMMENEELNMNENKDFNKNAKVKESETANLAETVKKKRTHRVGTITCGASLVIFGSLFLATVFTDAITYLTVIKFWPVILIGLGIEIIISNIGESELKYDKGSIAIIILMGLFAAGMAGTSLLIEAAVKYF